MVCSLKNIRDRFKNELGALYPVTEIDSLFYRAVDHILGYDRIKVHMNMNEPVAEERAQELLPVIQRLAQGEPIQYILGVAWFGGLSFCVDPRVLIPRPETEELCGLVVAENAGRRYQEISILDIGTGSGCIPIVLKRKFPYSRTTGVDVSEDALALARMNAERLQTEVTFRVMDVLNERSAGEIGGFDIMVSNPPYITESEKGLMHRNVLQYEPSLALFVADRDPLLFYRAIAALGRLRLRRPGMLYFEINERFGAPVAGLLESMGYEKVAVSKDMNGKDRFVRAELRAEMLDSSYWYAVKSEPI